MASRLPEYREETVQLRTRKGHDMIWSCDKHAEPIAFQCKEHKISICHRCATKDHAQNPCVLEDIEDVVFEMRRKLEDTQIKIAPAKKRLKTLRSKLKSSETSTSNHLQSVSDNVNDKYDGKLSSVKDKERDEIRLINEEADVEIGIINEKRERRIKACMEEAEKQRQISKDIQARLLSEIKKIDTRVRKVIEDLESKNQHEINIMDNLDSKIEGIKQNDKTLVNEAPQIIASLDESLRWNIHQETADYLDQIEREVQRVKFVEGKVGGEHYERIDGYIGRPIWELVKSIDIPSIVNKPLVCGLISDDEICVLDVSDYALYVTNISTKHTEKAIAGEPNMCVTSCAPVDSDVIVCGKEIKGWASDRLDGCITLYDRQWKAIRDITIPRNTSSILKSAHVDVDRDGMILAAQPGQSNIYVINPADGKIVNTITMQGQKVYDRIQVLSSGDIVVQTDRNKFTAISRSGEEKAVIHHDEWEGSQCYVDKLTDTLYITFSDKEGKIVAVDQVSFDGNIQARRIVECKQSDNPSLLSPCVLTPSATLVACVGGKLFLYKNRFLVAVSLRSGQSETEENIDPDDHDSSIEQVGRAESQPTDSDHCSDGRIVMGKLNSLGGKLSTESHGFTLDIPSGALDETASVEITLEVLTELPPGFKLQDDECLVSHGFQCYPSGLRFKKPATLTIPHCAVLTDPRRIKTVLYSWDRRARGSPRRILEPINKCQVCQHCLKISMTHFSGGYIAIIWDWIFPTSIRLSCMPFLPKVMPRTRRPTLEVRLVKKPHGQDWRDVHRFRESDKHQPAKDDDDVILFKGRTQNLTITCQVEDDLLAPKTVEYGYICSEPKDTQYFPLDLTDKSDESLVILNMNQKESKEIEFNTRFAGEEGPPDVPEPRSDPVSDEKLEALASHVPHRKYSELADGLGIEFNEANNILAKDGNDYTKAIRESLAIWKNRTGGSLTELKEILQRVNLGGLIRHIR